MSLKKSIIIVNEFSIKKPGGNGSRGATPGRYVERYMARKGATEPLAPIQRLRTDAFIMRYMARESAVERAPTRHSAKRQMRQAQGLGGVAFGYGSVSLSEEQLKAASRDIQSLFEAGHTVLKTVLSFDEAYLRYHGIVGADFHCENRGDYRGHLDQMKLRMAIMHGLDRMSTGTSGFDDLRYVAVIQVDTEHVHAHIAAVDAGQGQITTDGAQRGKLLDRHKSRLRRGIDAWLDEKQTVAHLSSAVGYERRNVTTFIKRWAHQSMRAEALPQFLLACLPADRTLWRAGTRDHRMRKANQLLTDMVTEQLDRAGSPMPAAMEKIVDYANQRRAAEGLAAEDWQRLVADGRNQIVERAVNGVYQMLRSLPADELRIRTPMLEIMSMDYQQLAVLAADRRGANGPQEESDLAAFGLRLRSYASRLEHHTQTAAAYRDLARQWRTADRAGVAAADSRPLYEFYRYEEEYQHRLMAKYQYFLPFIGDTGMWFERHRQVAEYGQQLVSLMGLRADASLQRMRDGDEAERIGRQIYDQPGGRLLTEGRGGRLVLDHRIATMRGVYDGRIEELRADLAGSGLVLRPAVSTGADEPVSPGVIDTGAAYAFDEVKALDLHHLAYDFLSDVEVGSRSRHAFSVEARQRRKLLIAAMAYLDGSGQSWAIADLPIDDVAAMTGLAGRLEAQAEQIGTSVLPSRFTELRASQEEAEKGRRAATSTLDAGLVIRVQDELDQAVSDVAGRTGRIGLDRVRDRPGKEPSSEQTETPHD
ncbi:relaxase MobL [Actinomadura syzygii]|uniref:relaxase MobL n=1 Tax=Actinomadura syzygii TaxID=1427538 RepID=UPI0016521E5F|nr:relaxase MobL [Actinomadura syzygii]